MESAWTRRIITLTALAAFCLSGGFLENCFGQTLAAPTELPKIPATTVAMMDVAYIFKNYKTFNEQMKVLEQKAQGIRQNMAATQAQLDLLKARTEQTADKVEKEKLEIKLATQSTEFQLFARKVQQETIDAETKIYHETYILLQEEAKKYCRARGIQVALRSNRDLIKADDRNSVMQGLNRSIVFSDAPDITDDILKAMDVAVAVNAARAKPGETRPR